MAPSYSKFHVLLVSKQIQIDEELLERKRIYIQRVATAAESRALEQEEKANEGEEKAKLLGEEAKKCKEEFKYNKDISDKYNAMARDCDKEVAMVVTKSSHFLGEAIVCDQDFSKEKRTKAKNSRREAQKWRKKARELKKEAWKLWHKADQLTLLAWKTKREVEDYRRAAYLLRKDKEKTLSEEKEKKETLRKYKARFTKKYMKIVLQYHKIGNTLKRDELMNLLARGTLVSLAA